MDIWLLAVSALLFILTNPVAGSSSSVFIRQHDDCSERSLGLDDELHIYYKGTNEMQSTCRIQLETPETMYYLCIEILLFKDNHCEILMDYYSPKTSLSFNPDQTYTCTELNTTWCSDFNSAAVEVKRIHFDSMYDIDIHLRAYVRTSPPENEEHDDEDVISVVLGGVFAGILFIGVTVTVVVCVCRPRTNQGNAYGSNVHSGVNVLYQPGSQTVHNPPNQPPPYQPYQPVVQGQPYQPVVQGQPYQPPMQPPPYEQVVQGQPTQPQVEAISYQPPNQTQSYNQQPVYQSEVTGSLGAQRATPSAPLEGPM